MMLSSVALEQISHYSLPSVETEEKQMNPHARTLMLVAAHKNVEVPKNDFYLPIHVGKATSNVDLPFQGDDTGDNISHRNAYYCELTGLYWAWRNLDFSAIGLCHYRRYFRGTMNSVGGKRILSAKDADELLEKYDVVVAKPRNYYIETVETHYRNAHVSSDLDVIREIIEEISPEYVEAFDATMSQTKLSLGNMMLAQREAFDDYASWLFPLLDRLYQRIGNEGRNQQDSRYVGFVAERLINVWVRKNRSTWRIGYVPIINTEGENKLRKAIGLLGRKMRGGKTKSSGEQDVVR